MITFFDVELNIICSFITIILESCRQVYFCAILQGWYGVIISDTIFIGSISFLYVLTCEKHLQRVTLLQLEIKISCWFPRYLYEIRGFLRLVFLASSILGCIFNATETRDITESFRRNNIMREEKTSIWTFMVCHNLLMTESDWKLACKVPQKCRDCSVRSCLAAYIKRHAFRLKEQMCSHTIFCLLNLNIINI